MKIECGITLIALHSIVFLRVRGIFTRPMDELFKLGAHCLVRDQARTLSDVLIVIRTALKAGFLVIILDCNLQVFRERSLIEKALF